MQTRHRIATAAVGLALVTAPTLALAAPSGAAPSATPSPSAPVLSAAPVAATPSPTAAPTRVATTPPLVSVPVRSTETPGDGSGGIQVPAGRVSVGHRDSDDTAVIALAAVGALLLAGGTTVAIRRRS